MEPIKKSIGITLKALVIAACGLSTSFQASAALMYEGYADLELELISVSSTTDQGDNCNGSGACDGSGNGWSVSSNSGISDSEAVLSGSGSAEFGAFLFPTKDWAIGDLYSQTSESFGEAGGLTGNSVGTASSFADTFFSVTLENRSGSGNGSGGQSRDFEFDFYTYVSAFLDGFGFPGVDGGAYAEIVLFDSVEILFSSAEAFVGGPTTDFPPDISDSLTFTVDADSSYTFSGIVYTDGYAIAVPEPSVLGLMGLGLIGLFRRQFANRPQNVIENML